MCHRLNNPDKGAVTHAVVHRALGEYLSSLIELENEAEREKLWKDIFEAYDLEHSSRV
jgi:pumilio homology domain family member 6